MASKIPSCLNCVPDYVCKIHAISESLLYSEIWNPLKSGTGHAILHHSAQRRAVHNGFADNQDEVMVKPAGCVGGFDGIRVPELQGATY